MEHIGENIKKFRIFRGITQMELGAAVGRSKNVVSNWERGDNFPDLDTLAKLCRILKVTPNQMFGWDPCPEYDEYLRKTEKIKAELNELRMKRTELDYRILQMQQELDKQVSEE